MATKKASSSKKKPQSGIKYKPKKAPARGAHGRFISNKKKVKPKKKVVVIGPYLAPYGQSSVKRYYKNRWYFSVEDLLGLGYSEVQFKPLKELKIDKKVGGVFDENITTIMEEDCADHKGAEIIMRAMIKEFNVTFPGSFFRWLKDMARLPFNITEPKTDKSGEISSPHTPPGNPSDRG